MTIKSIRIHPDPILSVITEEIPLDQINTEETHQLIRDLIETAKATDALGLAAPQIGVSKSVIVYTDDKNLLEVIVNPKIIAFNGHTMSYAEGCKSVTGIKKDIKRARNITVTGFSSTAEPIKIKPLRKTTVIILQHEIDHLNGITIVERKGKKIA